MDFWQYIEVLRRPTETWFFSKDRTQEKINILTKIAVDGYPSLIYRLTDFLKDENKEIRETTCRTITHLFKKIDSKKGYYGALKHCDFSESDIDFYEVNFPKEQFVELLAICSLNGSGYIREKAVKKLTQIENPRAIQFLIYRLADWVLPVRNAALNGLEKYKRPIYIDSLIANLPLFEWLQKVERTNLNEIYHDIIDFIASENRDYVISNFKKYPDRLRLLLAKHISNSLFNYTDELSLFLTDKHFLIRKLVVDHLDILGQSETSQLLRDKSANVRLGTLYHLKDRDGFEVIVKEYLADTSASIRQFARFALRQSGIDYATFYYENLKEARQTIGSLCGLAEVEAKQYAETAMVYLKSKSIKTKKTAFITLGKLDKESAYEFALANLSTSYVGLRNLIIEYISNFPRHEVLTKARDIYRMGNYSSKKAMLKLFNKIGGWTAIPDLMIGTIDENGYIRNLGKQYIETWKVRAINLYAEPKADDLKRARQIFNLVNEIHEDRRYFETNPVDGLEFYFES